MSVWQCLDGILGEIILLGPNGWKIVFVLPPVIIHWELLIARASVYWKCLHQLLPAGCSLLC